MSKKAWIKENLKEGELYAGILLGLNDEPDQHIILLEGEAESVNWDQAKKWAEYFGGELPTRREQSLLFANLKEQFQPHWYWSSEQHAAFSVFAWSQNFDYGLQNDNDTSFEGRARAVRRIPIIETEV